jgi:hypothetical protein
MPHLKRGVLLPCSAEGYIRRRTRLLDQTMCVFGLGMAKASSHDATNLPVRLAGSCFKYDQHLAHDPNSPPPLCNLWVQMRQELGLNVAEFGTSNAETLAGLSLGESRQDPSKGRPFHCPGVGFELRKRRWTARVTTQIAKR